MGDFSAHAKSPVKSLAVIAEGPQILTGGGDSTIKVWSMADGTPKLHTTINTPGPVHHIEIKDNSTVLFADDECAVDTGGANAPKVPSGVVRILNQANPTDMASSIVIRRSEEMPYAHPQSINSFVVLNGPDGLPYVLTSGLEGMIRMWRFSSQTNGFEHVGALEGHVRGITALLLNDSHLWSASLDHTVRVWELNTSKCIGTLSAANGGHTAAVSCLAAIPAVASAPTGSASFIVSGSMDGEVKMWQPGGELAWSGSHAAEPGVGVTALHVFQDLIGGKHSLVANHKLIIMWYSIHCFCYCFVGQPTLLIGLSDGKIMARSCVTMGLLFSIDIANFGPHKIHMQTVWALTSLGHSCFVSSDNTGRVIIWRAMKPLIDAVTQM